MTAIAAIMSLTLTLSASEASLQAAWVEDTVPFHRPAQLAIRLNAPRDAGEAKVAFAEVPEGIGIGRLQPCPQGLASSATYLLKVDALEPGDYDLGMLTLTYDDGVRLESRVPPFTARPLTQAEQAAVMRFAPNAGPIDPPAPNWTWVLAAAILAASAALLLAWLVQARPFRNAAAQDTRPKTCWDLALLRLKELEHRVDSPRAFYEGLSEILRDYAAARFDWPIHEWTTPEFRKNDEAVGALGSAIHARFATLLHQCDMVIFAQRRPRAEDMRRSAAWARAVIEASVPPQAKEEAA